MVTTLHLPVSMERCLSGRWRHRQLLKGLGSNNRSVWKDAPSDLLGIDLKIVLSNKFALSFLGQLEENLMLSRVTC